MIFKSFLILVFQLMQQNGHQMDLNGTAQVVRVIVVGSDL